MESNEEGIIEIAHRTRSYANTRMSWQARHRAIKADREAARLAWLKARRPVPAFPAVVTLTRIAPRPLDDDNLCGALKGIRDELADVWALPSDRDPRVTWAYAQETGAPGFYGVRVTMEAMSDVEQTVRSRR